jgi:hypothetical protein
MTMWPGRWAAVPPASETVCGLHSPPITITPFRFHVPPRAPSALQMVCTGPPERSIFFSLESAKKAMKRLSGDQNGSAAPSVPARGVISAESSARIQICCLPSFTRTSAAKRPSGETASDKARDFRKAECSSAPAAAAQDAGQNAEVRTPRERCSPYSCSGRVSGTDLAILARTYVSSCPRLRG